NPCLFFSHDTATTELYTLSLHDALPICRRPAPSRAARARLRAAAPAGRDANGPAPGGTTRSGRTAWRPPRFHTATPVPASAPARSEEHTSELQSQSNLVCRLLLEKKKVQ